MIAVSCEEKKGNDFHLAFRNAEEADRECVCGGQVGHTLSAETTQF